MPRKASKVSGKRVRSAGKTPEEIENTLVNLATDLAMQQLADGTASSQVITHFLKIGSTRDRLEKERLQEENKLLRAKTEAIESSRRSEELFTEAIAAMTSYRPRRGVEVDDVFDD